MTEKEFTKVVTEYHQRIYRFLYKNLNDVSICEDILQDTFIKYWDKRKKIDHSKARSWLFTTAYHKLIDFIRKHKKQIDFNDEKIHSMIYDSTSSKDNDNLINTYLELLTTEQRTIIILRDIEGYNYEEIREIMSLTLPQVKVNLFRARKKLKDLITKHEI